MIAVTHIFFRFLADLLRLLLLSVRRKRSLQAENLFLRRQLALYKERGIKPRRIDAATRISLVFLSRLFDWRDALVVVRPETLIRWHRAGWRLLWRWRCRPGRPPIPRELRQLIRRMATQNRSWGEERIANELLLKLGVRVSPRTVRKYMPKRPAGCPREDQRWSTFLRNRAEAVVACDFFVAVTATFRMLHYNHGRPHMSLGPGGPDPPTMPASAKYQKSRHRLGEGVVVLAKSILGGLHHEYSFVAATA